MEDTIWKKGGKEPLTSNISKNPNETPSISNIPSYSDPLLSGPSITNDTMKRMKRVKKKIENPKNIPILENIYESEGKNMESVYSSPENIFTQFFEGPEVIREGLTLPGNLKPNSPGSDKSASEKTQDFINKKKERLNDNLTLSQKAYTDKYTQAKAEVDKLKGYVFKIDKLSTDFTTDVNSKPPDSPADQTLMKQQGEDATKEASDALRRIGYIIKLIIDKIIQWTKLGIAKFKLKMYEFVLKYKSMVTEIARALTGYTKDPSGNKIYHVTDTEIKTFSHEIVRFMTILMSWVFLYNWYYVMFFLKPEQQFKLKLNDWYKNHSMIYAAIGPPLRAVENIDWFILEFLPKIRYLIPSNGIIFFTMSIIFVSLVQKGKQWTIMNDFFSAINKSYSTSFLSALVIGCIVIYGLSFAGYFASAANFALLKTWYTALIWAIVTVIYLLCIITLGVPLGMLAVCGYIFFYSFFAIILYNGFTIGPVMKAISEQITNISSVNFDTRNMTWSQWAYVTLQKFVKYFLYFMFEIFILYILIHGLVVYGKGYNIPLAEKATLQNAFSSAGAFKDSFKHLYTWLIIINVLLIVLIFVIMKIRYDAIKHLAPNQPFNLDTGETMFQRLTNIGSSAKNSLMGNLSAATNLKNSLSQNTFLGKAPGVRGTSVPTTVKGVPVPGKTGVPGVGDMINAAGKLDPKTLGAVTSSAMSAAKIASSDPKLKEAFLSGDAKAILSADTSTLKNLADVGANAANAVAADPNASKGIANLTGSDTNAVGNLIGIGANALNKVDTNTLTNAKNIATGLNK
jgi:hypothetical protein